MKKTLTDTDVRIPANGPDAAIDNPAETAEAAGTAPPAEEVADDGADATATCADAEQPAAETGAEPPAATDTTPRAEPPLPLDLEARLAEAETRGYLRGRNERIEQLMREPAIFERQRGHQSIPSSQASGEEWQADSQPMILNNPRVSIWDR